MIKRSFLTLTALAAFAMLFTIAPTSAEKADNDGAKTKVKSSYPKSVEDNGPLAEDAKNPAAIYLKMSDGTKIACDVWLPKDYDRKAEKPEKLPALMRMTRYWREMHLTEMTKQNPQMLQMAKQSGMMRDAGHAKWATENGYAYVSVDARGTGASFGTRKFPWAKREIIDYGEIADWISKQSWSNGRIGAFGVSYEGNTAEFIAANKHPAVKVVIPMFDEFDVYHHVAMPGGVFNDWFIKNWGAFNSILDANDMQKMAARLGIPEQMRMYVSMLTTGVKPVDADTKLKERKAAIKEHKENGDVYEMAKAIDYRDQHDANTIATLDDISPFSRKKDIEDGGAIIYGWGSWLDAGTAEGVLARFNTYKNLQKAVIGPWAHGGGANSSPFAGKAKDKMNRAAQKKAQMDFLNKHLKGSDEELAKRRKDFKPEIKYYMHGTGEWRTSSTWPPKTHLEGMSESAVDGREHWHFTTDKKLVHVADTSNKKFGTEEIEHKVDFTHNTGRSNRWHTQLNMAVKYEDRRMEDKKLVTFSSTLENDVEIIGSPIVKVRVKADQTDGAIFAYLMMFDPKTGASTYITEGQLRLKHRKKGEPKKAPYDQLGVYHSFKEADSMPVKKGEFMDVELSLFPTAVRIPKGMALRVGIGGHDASNFQRYPAEGELTYTFSVGAPQVSGIDLPIRHFTKKEAKEDGKEEKKGE